MQNLLYLEVLKAKNLQIESLRAISVLPVLLSHWINKPWIEKVPIATMGVDIFFVISGFLITGILLTYKAEIEQAKATTFQGLKVFYIRRFLRIFPIYYLVLLIAFLFNKNAIGDSIWWHVGYLSNIYIIKLGHWPGVISHFWSLSVEEHFYIIWPFLILLVPLKHLGKFMWLVWGGAILLRLFFYFAGYHYLWQGIFSLNCFDRLAIGGLLALGFHLNSDWLINKFVLNKTLGWVLFSMYITYLIVAFVIHGNVYDSYIVFGNILLALNCCYVIANTRFGIKGTLGNLLNMPWLIKLGGLSYGVYLFHNFVPGMLMGLKYPEQLWIRLIMYFAVTVAIAFVAHRLIEKPINKLKEHFTL